MAAKRRVGVLVIHGMGSQMPGFSAELIREVSRRLGKRQGRFEWQEIHWADVLRDRETRLWDCMRSATDSHGEALDLDWVGARKFVVHNFGDAAAYHRDFRSRKTAYRLVNQIVDGAVRLLDTRLGDRKSPIVVVAHSLGAHIMSNYIWDRQQAGAGDPLRPLPALVSMVTFGCNIPLFSLAYPVARPIDLPGQGVTKTALKRASRWLNYFDRDDVLGWPLKPLYEQSRSRLTPRQRQTVDRMADAEINVGSMGLSWAPSAHTGYWTDNDFTRPLADHLREIVAALDS